MVFRPKEKRQIAIRIPESLKTGLQEALKEIRFFEKSAEYDMEGVDDAIQVTGMFGGKFSKNARPFRFTYMTDPDEIAYSWTIEFSLPEIESIVSGKTEQLDLFKCVSPECGFRTNLLDKYCAECDYWFHPDHGSYTFPDAASKLSQFGLTNIGQNTSKNEICTFLGKPSKTGGDFYDEEFGYIDPWIAYEYKDSYLHFRFSEDENKIKLVSIYEPDWDKTD